MDVNRLPLSLIEKDVFIEKYVLLANNPGERFMSEQ
jgi:hypothetical protein